MRVTETSISKRTTIIPIIVTIVLIKFNTGAITPLVTVAVKSSVALILYVAISYYAGFSEEINRIINRFLKKQ